MEKEKKKKRWVDEKEVKEDKEEETNHFPEWVVFEVLVLLISEGAPAKHESSK